MRLCQGGVAGSGVIFREDFASWTAISDNGGIVVASALPTGGGISPTGVSGRVTYGGTEALGINATQMTIELWFKTAAAAVATPRRLLAKVPAALNDNQFFVQQSGAGLLNFAVANAIGDYSQQVNTNAALSVSTEYLAHLVYDGTLAAGSRAIIYLNGTVPAQAIAGTIPVVMRANAIPLTVFNFNAEATHAPDTDFILRRVQIYNFALGEGETF